MSSARRDFEDKFVEARGAQDVYVVACVCSSAGYRGYGVVRKLEEEGGQYSAQILDDHEQAIVNVRGHFPSAQWLHCWTVGTRP